MPQFTQDDRLLKVTTPLGDDVLLLDHFFGAESISAPFRFNLRLFSEKDDLQLKELMGQSVTVEIGTFDGDPRYFHGHVVSFAHAGSDGGFTFYDMQVGPWLDFLRRRQNCRIFQELKVEDILQEVFADYGALAKFDIRATSKDLLTMCVQYNETDFQFVSRLMEGLGWFYYFDHDDGAHTLVIDKDSPGVSPMPIQPDIEFNDSPGAEATDAIDRFESFRNMVPNKLALKTFDFKNPKDPLLAKTDTQHQMGDLPDMEWYEHHGPYTYKEFEEGDDLAKLRLEEAEARSKGFRGSSNCRGLSSGHSFTLSEHFLYDGEFLVLSVEHHGSNNYFERATHEPYRNSFTAMRKSVPFRPSSVTPRPVMRGPQSATVVGKDGEEIDCDEYGRIRVQFHWDREGQFNEQSSCWVRLAMPLAGSNFGFITVPRIGQEVLVDFLEGDPDLPVVVGSFYNEHHKPPWDLPLNKTQSGILTRSSKGGSKKNANALRFEDLKNHEEVWLHAERNQRIEVEVDESHSVGNDRSKTIGRDETTTVQRDRTETVTRDESITVGRNRMEVVFETELISIGKSRTVSVGTGETIAIATDQTVTVGASKTETVAANSTETVGASKSLTAGASYALTSPAIMQNSTTMVTTAGGSYTLGSPLVTISASGATIVNCPAITLTSGGASIVITAGSITISGPTVNVTGAGMVNVTGGVVKLNC